jgi:hypothetical protein
MASAVGAAATQPYRYAPTFACLDAAGVYVKPWRNPPTYPNLEVDTIVWLRVAGTTDYIVIDFAKDPRHALALARDYRQAGQEFDGETARQALNQFVRKGNVVFFAAIIPWHLTAHARLIITRCLRP